MADIELVIKIPQELYDRATNGELTEIDSMFVCGSVVNGTPLPKGHGRLIDADKFHEVVENIPIKDTDKWFNWMQKTCNRLADAPTIIEADKESEE